MVRVPRGYAKLNKMAARAAEKLLAKEEKKKAWKQRVAADGVVDDADAASTATTGGAGDSDMKKRKEAWKQRVAADGTINLEPASDGDRRDEPAAAPST